MFFFGRAVFKKPPPKNKVALTFRASDIYIYIPGTQMTLVLTGKGLLLEGSNPKIEDKQVPGIYIYNVFSYSKIFTVD